MKKRIIILGSVVLAVVVAWSVAWYVLAGLVRQNIEALAQSDGVSEPRVTCETLNVGGFPFRFDLDCGNAQVVSGDIVVDVAAVRASMLVYSPTHAVASLQGPAKLTDSFTGSRNDLDWSSLEASVNLNSWRIGRVSVSGKDVVWSDALFGNAVIAKSALVEGHLFDIPEQHDPARGTAAIAGYLRMVDGAWPALTLNDSNAEVQVELSGLPDDVRNWGDASLLLPQMQANGAKLKIVATRATDGDATLDASGELALDAEHRPEGQVTITSHGVEQRIGPVLGEPWRSLVLGTPTQDGGHTNLISLRAGAVFVGLVPVATLTPLF